MHSECVVERGRESERDADASGAEEKVSSEVVNLTVCVAYQLYGSLHGPVDLKLGI